MDQQTWYWEDVSNEIGLHFLDPAAIVGRRYETLITPYQREDAR